MLSKEELAKRETCLKRKQFVKLKIQEKLAKKEARRKERSKLNKKLKKQKKKEDNQKQLNKIQVISVDVNEAVENERKDKKLLEPIRQVVDKRKSKTGESCPLRSS